jgi:hypothetical protein
MAAARLPHLAFGLLAMADVIAGVCGKITQFINTREILVLVNIRNTETARSSSVISDI